MHTNVIMFNKTSIKWRVMAFSLILLLIPAGLIWTWGPYFGSPVYEIFQAARHIDIHSIDTISRSTLPIFSSSRYPLAASFLYTMCLRGLDELGLPLSTCVLVLDALGWGILANLAYLQLRARKSPYPAVIWLLPLFLSFNPFITVTLGSPVSWSLVWLAAAIITLTDRWPVGYTTAALVLMLATDCNLSTLSLALLVVLALWYKKRSFPHWLGIVWCIAGIYWLFTAPITKLHPAGWWVLFQTLVNESEFYGLALVPVVLGLAVKILSYRQNPPFKSGFEENLFRSVMVLALGCVAVGLIIADCDETGQILLYAGSLHFGIAGMQILFSRFVTGDETRVSTRQFSWIVSGLILLLIGIGQMQSLVSRYQLRPVVQHTLEYEAGQWLQTHSAVDSTVLGSARLGYFAERPVVAWDGLQSDTALLSSLSRYLAGNPPQYCVSFNSLAWERLTRSDWFIANYELLQSYGAAYSNISPLNIWAYRFDELVKLFGGNVGNLMTLISYSYAESAAPGEPVDIRLYWEAQVPLNEEYVAFVHILNANGELVASHDAAPGPYPTRSWLPDLVVFDNHSVELPADMPAGEYLVQVGVYQWPTVERLPVWDKEGQEQPNRVFVLGMLAVR